ncbi:MAG: peptide deformylase [Candidatus Heimdallarchaeota archaeon]
MPVLPILLLGNPLLREQTSPVETFNLKELQHTIINMEDTLIHLQKQEGLGRGLAAPQIGVLKQIIVFKTPGAPHVMINPKIREMSSEQFVVWDSCFCFKLAFFVEVKRFQKISVEYQDAKGVQKVIDAENALAELFQHEIDHLNGILAIDRMISTRRILMREEWENQFQ